MNEITNRETAKSALKRIVALQFSGQLQSAHDAYIEFFQNFEVDYNALNLFGICCKSLGKIKKAEKVFERVLVDAPHISEARLHLANCRFELGNFEMARDALHCEKLSDLTNPEELVLAARICVALGDKKQATLALQEALTIEPKRAETLLMMGSIHLSLGELEESSAILKKVLFEDPNNCDALLGLAEVDNRHENWQSVLVNTHLVLDLFPENVRAQYLTCIALDKLEKNREFLEAALTLVSYCPDDADALAMLCHAHHKNAEYVSCILAAEKALCLATGSKTVMILKADSYFSLGFYERALEQINEVLTLFPNDIQTLQNQGVLLERMLQIDDAIAVYDRILQQKPDRQSTRFNKSTCLLLKDELDEGFRLYESRFNRETNLIPNYRGDEPIWNGEDLSGKHLLIHPEQGYGDTLMFCRFISLLEDKSASLTFAVPSALRSLIETLDAKAKIITVGDEVSNIDFHVPLMSLPHLTKSLWQQIPCKEKYLVPPADKLLVWEKIFYGPKKFRVGFACSGNPKHGNDAARSMNMSSFLKSLPEGPEYHLLQKDLRQTDTAAISRRPDVIVHHDRIDDFADTAALCQMMDIIICVDTSIAHLAGALGQKTLLMLPKWPDWRWGLGRSHSPWYPNTTLIRQSSDKDWAGVLDYVGYLIVGELTKWEDRNGKKF